MGEEEHQKLSSRLISSAEGGAGFLHKIPKPTAWRDGLQVLKELEEGAKPLNRGEKKERVGEALAVRLRGAKHGTQAAKESRI